MTIPSIDFNYDKTNEAEFEIFSLTDLYIEPDAHPELEYPHKVKFFNLIYIEKGRGTHMIDFVDHTFDAGTIIFVQPEQVHAFDFKDRPTGKVILFTQGFLDQVHANMRLPNYTPTHLNSDYDPLCRLNTENHQRCRSLISDLNLEMAHPQSGALIVMYLFSALSLVLHRLRPNSKMDKLSEANSRRFADFINLLITRYTEKRDANWYATQINTTYKTLNEVCKLATNLTTKQLIDAYTILEIKRRLLVSNVSTQQIAYDHGFDDPSNFVKYFKNRTQSTPSQFQHKYAKADLTKG